MVSDVAKQQATLRLVNDQANVAADAHRPEIRVSGAVELVEAQTLACWIDLQIKRRGLGELLLLASQFAQASGEGICNSEFHWLPLS